MDETGTDTMAAAETQIESESERIHRWRAEELERAGYTSSQALELALRHDVDLHDAVDLLRRGCSIELAMKILT
jgi:hypothetical protein